MIKLPDECTKCKYMYKVESKYCCRKYLGYCLDVIVLCRIQNCAVQNSKLDCKDFLYEN